MQKTHPYSRKISVMPMLNHYITGGVKPSLPNIRESQNSNTEILNELKNISMKLGKILEKIK